MVNQTNSQMQFLQLVCVVLVVATLIGLAAAYVLYRDVHSLQVEVAAAKSQADRFRSEIVRLQDDVETLKNVMGYPLSEVGQADDVDATTIVGKVQKDINQYIGTGALPRPTLRNAIIELYSRWQDVTKERNALKANLEKLSATKS
jgi:ABC-type Fe3+-citrate transport system substrate-binding protein